MLSKTLVVIPAWNEEESLGPVIQGVAQHLPQADILVVDDGSADRTREVAVKAGARVVSHPFNLGYGVALQTGYRYALKMGYDALAQMDGDGQHDPSFLAALLSALRNQEVDVAIGSRFLAAEKDGAVRGPYRAPLVRRLGMRLFSVITSLIIKQKVTDPTSGFQAMNRRVMEWVSGDRFPCDYPDADVIIMLHRAGFQIREVPVVMHANSGKKSMHRGWKPVYYVFKMFLSILVTLMRKP